MTRPQPSRYDVDLAERICESLAEGRSLKDACADHGVKLAWVQKWVREDIGGFRVRYQAARLEQAGALVDEIIALSDDCPLSQIAISRARLQINTRQWVAAAAKDLFTPVLKPERGEQVENVVEPSDFLRAWRAKNVPAEVN